MQHVTAVAPGVHQLRTLFANLFFIEGDGGWTLVDAGIPGYASTIKQAARFCLGTSDPPQAIILTHGHIDHVGSLLALLEDWDVPVYAHAQEVPHLNGHLDYPPPDPLAGGGAIAWTSRLLPRAAIDVGARLQVLPTTSTLDTLPGWQTIHTPGHTEGHVSLFRPSDRTLIAGDAVTTTRQESLLAVSTQKREIHGPPAYFTTDWDHARASVRRVAALDPQVLASGHGQPMRGVEMQRGLHELAAHFDERERPRYGRYARQPARLENGHYALPADPLVPVARAAAVGIAAAATAGMWMRARRTSRSERRVEHEDRDYSVQPRARA